MRVADERPFDSCRGSLGVVSLLRWPPCASGRGIRREFQNRAKVCLEDQILFPGPPEARLAFDFVAPLDVPQRLREVLVLARETVQRQRRLGPPPPRAIVGQRQQLVGPEARAERTDRRVTDLV